MVAVKNHHNAVTNPMAHLRFEVTVDQVLAAPRVAGPFGVLDCAPQSDGAAAVILVAEELADRYTDKPVWVRGFGLALDRVMHAHKHDMTTFPSTVRAAKAAYAMAGIGPGDIDVAEIHDCFSGIELMNYEDLGFCDRGDAAKLIESGETSLQGRLPVNPSGGLKAKGHPPGATGVAQCVELFEQLRGQASNQVDPTRGGALRRTSVVRQPSRPSRSWRQPDDRRRAQSSRAPGQGLGEAVAATFAAAGRPVVLSDVDPERRRGGRGRHPRRRWHGDRRARGRRQTRATSKRSPSAASQSSGPSACGSTTPASAARRCSQT